MFGNHASFLQDWKLHTRDEHFITFSWSTIVILIITTAHAHAINNFDLMVTVFPRIIHNYISTLKVTFCQSKNGSEFMHVSLCMVM